LPLRDGGLRDQAAEDDLTSRIEPVPRKRIDDLAPDPLLQGIEIRRGFRTTPARDAGDDGKRS
jgi:hypothetical protein